MLFIIKKDFSINLKFYERKNCFLGMSTLAWLRERVKKLSWRVGLALILTVVVFVSVFAVVGTGWLRIGNRGKVVSSGQNHFSVRWMGFSPYDYSNEYPEYYICINNLADDVLQMSDLQEASEIREAKTNKDMYCGSLWHFFPVIGISVVITTIIAFAVIRCRRKIKFLFFYFVRKS